MAGINEFFADVVAALTNDVIPDPTNIRMLIGLGEDDGRCLLDTRTLSSSKLIKSSPEDQHGVMAHMRAWLGKHRIKKNMSDEKKAKLLRNLMQANVVWFENILKTAIENPEVKMNGVTTHEELLETNLKFLEIFLRIEKESKKRSQ